MQVSQKKTRIEFQHAYKRKLGLNAVKKDQAFSYPKDISSTGFQSFHKTKRSSNVTTYVIGESLYIIFISYILTYYNLAYGKIFEWPFHTERSFLPFKL